MKKLRIALVGIGKRAKNVYYPIIKKMNSKVELCAVMSRTERTAKDFGVEKNIPWYSNIHEMINQEKPDIAIITTSRNNHKEPFIALAESNVNILIETPLAETYEDMIEMLSISKKSKSIIEVAEQFYRYPEVQIVRKILNTGIMGKVNIAFSHSVGHGYHGISLIRSLLGFDTRPVRVIGLQKNYPVINHIWRKNQPKRNNEKWQHGLLEFENGQSGIYHFSSLTYGSPLRHDRTKNPFWFYSSKGMGMGTNLNYLKDEDKRIEIPIKINTKEENGTKYITSCEADFKNSIVWKNPLNDMLISGYEFGVAMCIFNLIESIKNNAPLEYGIENGFIDRQIELMLEKSWNNENTPISI